MALTLTDDTIEEARRAAEEERRRQQAPSFDFSQPVAAPPVTYDGGFTGWGGQSVVTPQGPQQPQGLTPWNETVGGRPTYLNAEGYVVDATGAYAPSNTWDSYNASANVLNTPAPPANEGGYGFEGQQWMVAPPEPEYTPAPNFTAVPPPENPWGFGANVGIGERPVDVARKRFAETGNTSLLTPEQLGSLYPNKTSGLGGFASGMTSGESFLNNVYAKKPLGTQMGETLERIPGVGGVARTAADVATAPATWLTALAGPSVPVVGSMFKGPVAKRLAGEIAVGAAGIEGGKKAPEIAREQFGITDPYALGAIGVGAGLATGLGTYGALKAAPKAFKGARVAGRELTTGRLAGETGAIDFTKIRPNDYDAPLTATEARLINKETGSRTWRAGDIPTPPVKEWLVANKQRAGRDVLTTEGIIAQKAKAGEFGPPEAPAASGVTPPPRASRGIVHPAYEQAAEARRAAKAQADAVLEADWAAYKADHPLLFDAEGNWIDSQAETVRAIAPDSPPPPPRVPPTGTPPPPKPTGGRVGSLLKLPEKADTPQQVLKIAGDAEKRVASLANQMEAADAAAWRTLGPQFKDDTGNIYLRNVKPSQAEIDAGLPGALKVRVVERPNEYVLTRAQRAAVEKLGATADTVKAERNALGATVNELGMDEGEQYMHRVALKPTEARQAEALVNVGPGANELNANAYPTPGKRLAVGKDKTRLFDDPIEGVQEGVVYGDPRIAARQNIETGLTKAANAHVKALLAPFGQTPAERVPAALRAQMEGLRQKVSSLKATGARLGQKQDDAITAFLATDEPNLDALKQALDVRVGANAVGKQGVNFGKNRPQLARDIADIRREINTLGPKWRQAIDAARSPLPGRRSIPMEVAPALAGTDFDNKTAARIISHYGGGIRVGDRVLETRIAPVRALNKLLIPINATGDFSVTLNQLAMTGAKRPIQFATNLAKSFRDMVDTPNYQAWLATKQEPSRYVTVLGGGSGSDFTSPWLERVPVFRQAQYHFQRFGNRMRVDGFESAVKTREAKLKRALTDTEKEQIGKAVDRVTGIARSKATDAETLAQFAPNFLRSTIENLGHAAMDGSIEGQIARGYLRNYVALGTAMVAGVAAAQNRDLSEVLTPFDKKAWDRGQIRLNPNFMSVRVAGQDIKVFGTYDSLVALTVAAADAGFRALDTKDAMQLFDFVGYAGSTKGSPATRFLTDLIKGETFTGEKPLSLGATAARLMPITASTAIQDAERGMSGRDIAIDTGLSSIGAKSNPVTDWEKMDEWSKANNGVPYDQASPIQQQQAKEATGYKSTNPETVKRNEQNTILREQNTARQAEIDKLGPGADWRDQYHLLEQRIAGQYDAKDVLDPFTGKPYSSAMHQAIAEWSAVLDKATPGVKTDYAPVDAWRAANPEKAKLVDEYMAGKTNTDLSPLVTQYKAAAKAVGESGYFDLRDRAWAEAQKANPAYAKFPDYYAWEAAARKDIDANLDPKIPKIQRDQLVETILGKQPATVVFSKLKNVYETQWAQQHAKDGIAQLAYEWGYYSPTKVERAIIGAGQ